MTMPPQWDAETHAMMVLERLLGGTTKPVDPGGGPTQLHDFELTLPDGRTVAVEVTRHNLPAALATAAEVAKQVWQFPGLNRRWWVNTTSTVRVRQLQSELGGLLEQLEAAGLDTLHLSSRRIFGDPLGIPPGLQPHRQAMDQTGTLAVGQRLFELGVRLAYTVEPPGTAAGQVVLGHASEGGATGASVIVSAAERLANLPDNAAKLAAANGCDERHLFIWAEYSRSELVAALEPGFDGIGTPTEAPRLPACVDAVWLATASVPTTVWCFRHEGGWTHHGTLDTPAP